MPRFHLQRLGASLSHPEKRSDSQEGLRRREMQMQFAGSGLRKFRVYVMTFTTSSLPMAMAIATAAGLANRCEHCHY